MLNRADKLFDNQNNNSETKPELVSSVSIHHLPLELITYMLAYLSPEVIAKKILLLGKTFTAKIKNNYLWQRLWERKFEIHFPHIIASKRRIREQKIDWYKEFIDSYSFDYNYLSMRVAAIFSSIKEADSAWIYRNERSLIEIPFYYLFERDQHDNTLLSWAQIIKNQTTLDYFYDLFKSDFVTTHRILPNIYNYSSILQWAIACHQSRNEITELLAEGHRLDAFYYNNNSSIHVAAEAGNLDILKFILEIHPGFLNRTNEHGQTPLMLAAENGQVSVVKYLTQQNEIDLEAKSTNVGGKNFEKTALFLACEAGHYKVVSELLKANANASTPRIYMKFLPIHSAAQEGHLDVIKTFFELRPELIDQPDTYGQTPFLWAAANDHAHVVEYLLSIKAKINVYASTKVDHTHSNNGKTAMHWAAENGNKEVVEMLLRAGIDATLAIQLEQYQAIHLAVRERKLQIVKTLIEHQPQLLNQKDFYGRTPLMLAVQLSLEHSAHEITIYLLSKKECDLHARSRNHLFEIDNGKTALHYAAENGFSNIVDILLRYGARVDLVKPVSKCRLTKSTRAEIERREKKLRNISYTPFSFFASSFGDARNRMREESPPEIRIEKRSRIKY